MRDWIRNRVIYWGDNKCKTEAFAFSAIITYVLAAAGIITTAALTMNHITAVLPTLLWAGFGVGSYFSGIIGTKLLGAYGWSADHAQIRDQWARGWEYESRYSSNRYRYDIKDLIHNCSIVWPGLFLIHLIQAPFLGIAYVFDTLNGGMENTMDRIATPKAVKRLPLPPSSRND